MCCTSDILVLNSSSRLWSLSWCLLVEWSLRSSSQSLKSNHQLPLKATISVPMPDCSMQNRCKAHLMQKVNLGSALVETNCWPQNMWKELSHGTEGLHASYLVGIQSKMIDAYRFWTSAGALRFNPFTLTLLTPQGQRQFDLKSHN